MRLLHGLGFEDDTLEPDPIGLEPRRLFGPEFSKRPQIFVGHGTAGGKRRRHRSVELCLEPARADADDEPSAGEDIDRRQHLGGEHGRPVRHHHHRQHQTDARGLGGDISRRRQLFVPALGALGEKFSALGVWIAGDLQIRQHDVVGQSQIVVTQRLALLRDLADGIGARQRPADRQVEPNLHLFLLVLLASNSSDCHVVVGASLRGAAQRRPRNL
jgi:hypothetical protein